MSRKTKDSKATENDFQYASAYALQVWRSDGTEMPSEYNQYERVEKGAKSIYEWQNKLGQALAAEIMPQAGGMFYLDDFPDHYHLRWYQARDDKKKNQAKHYYLFGYPEEPGANKARKYYRSPNHFLPHLIWLAGKSEDKGDCACEFCSGSKPITSKAAKAKASSSAGQAPSPDPTIAPPSTSMSNAATSPNASTAVSMSRNTSNVPTTKLRRQNSTPMASPQPSPYEAQASSAYTRPAAIPASHTRAEATPASYMSVRATQVAHPMPEVYPAAYTRPEATPSIVRRPYVAHDHGALFRAGEAVWFKNLNSWRVGMIVTTSPTLSIIPFSYPLYPLQEVAKEETDVRPFLAYSIPQINNALQDLSGRDLSQIDWQSLLERLGIHGDPTRMQGLAIEATKLAALRVDQCYSTFNALPEPVQDYDTFGGVFLGAEKICVGEAIRIKLQEQQEQAAEKGVPVVMVVTRILVGKTSNALFFEGSLWKLQHFALAQPTQIPNPGPLPSTMLGEKEFRDSILQSRGWRVQWMMMSQNISVNESGVRGRFYETRRLTPILNPEKFQDMIQQKHVEDIQALLNNRGDSKGPYVGRVANRAQAVAGAIPPGMPASLGPDVFEAQA